MKTYMKFIPLICIVLVACIAYLLFRQLANPTQSNLQVQQSGIKGMVVWGPTCPNFQGSENDPSCKPVAYKSKIRIFETDEKTQVSEYITNDNGTFVVNLKPGSYKLAPLPLTSNIQLSGFTPVEVKQNQYTEVNIEGDTGIR